MNGTTTANIENELTARPNGSIVSSNGDMSGNPSVSIQYGAGVDPFYDFPLGGALGGDHDASLVGAAKSGSVVPENLSSSSSSFQRRYYVPLVPSPASPGSRLEKLLKEREAAKFDAAQNEDAKRLSLIVMAAEQCSWCRGNGITRGGAICNCCYRKVYREVVMRWSFLNSIMRSPRIRMGNTFGNIYPSRPIENFLADVENTARHALPAPLFRVFSMHMLDGCDWRECCVFMGIDPGQKTRATFFQSVYRMEAALGKAWRELKPYALHPLDEYFSPVSPLRGA